MKEKEILQALQNLAAQQGFYSRLYSQLMELKETSAEKYQEIIAELEAQNFTDAVDLILYLET